MTKDSKYRFECLRDNCWTIIERIDYGSNVFDDLDYECEYETYDEALSTLRYIQWLEKTYSPKRK